MESGDSDLLEQQGAFIGASLNGAEPQADNPAIESWYGKSVPFKDILEGNAQMPNAQARAFVNAVQNAKETAQVRSHFEY